MCLGCNRLELEERETLDGRIVCDECPDLEVVEEKFPITVKIDGKWVHVANAVICQQRRG